ncbi:hypothetical protein [Pandoraea pulmonicola]|uniref:Uncharacterized protein n=1 Tax=Pandoraea pulmonicola TaxID=93221 RepID=A0AAJ4ZHJ5_PANPU|nr:hypothetical protein [Pandoraea pulmonicola]AJC22371.1 hypothetical protein RO07_21190 [Pandoraea pulmonicola]SUD95616.1 Uncharacterised protein [Pandoraea pulmonicola]
MTISHIDGARIAYHALTTDAVEDATVGHATSETALENKETPLDSTMRMLVEQFKESIFSPDPDDPSSSPKLDLNGGW